MKLVQAVKVCLLKYFTFSGRASRSEFWLFTLFLAIVSSIIQSYVVSGNGNWTFKFGLNFILSAEAHWTENLFTVTTFIPFIAALTRRLHDAGTSGRRALSFLAVLVLGIASFWVLPWQLSAVILVLLLVLAIYFLSKKSQPGPNKYGPNPHEVTP